MRLVILSPNYSNRVNWGHQHVRDAILKQLPNKSLQYGEGCEFRGRTHIPAILLEAQNELGGYPDAILMENWKNMSKFQGGNKTRCVKAFVLCDYYPDSRGNYGPYNLLLRRNGIDLAICNTPQVVRNVRWCRKEKKIPKRMREVWVPQGADTNIFKPRDVEKEYDVMAVFGLVRSIYPKREAVQRLVTNMPGVKALIGDWKTRIIHYEYAEAINRSRIFVCSNGINNQVLMKYFEVMASGTFLLTNLPNDYRKYGFEPGVHFGVWEDLNDLERKIRHYLKHEGLREEIAENGMRLVRERYSTEEIARQTIKAIEGEFN